MVKSKNFSTRGKHRNIVKEKREKEKREEEIISDAQIIEENLDKLLNKDKKLDESNSTLYRIKGTDNTIRLSNS